MNRFPLAFLLCAILSILPLMANAETDATDNIIYVSVPSNLLIQDKVFIVNDTPDLILQGVVLENDANGTMVGSVKNLVPTGTIEIADYPNNTLRKLKGKRLAIKIKGAKNGKGENSHVIKNSSVGGVLYPKVNIAKLNEIDPATITYDYNIRVSAKNNDLYLTISNNANPMDF